MFACPAHAASTNDGRGKGSVEKMTPQPSDDGRRWPGNGACAAAESPPPAAGAGGCRQILEALPAAVYATDVEGRLTFFNKAAVALAGRQPQLGSDRWCVSWRLFRPDGMPLPHDACAMAVALKEGRPVRGVEAIVERPDGSRVHCMPYPTPLYDAEGRLVGGVNMLVDITDRWRAAEAQLRLAQTMAAIAQLTGGIAHDFNNLLAAVIGSLELLTRALSDGDLRRCYVDSALRAALGGTRLTDRLFALARETAHDPAASG
jgi:PAS domain S-box-containing protein